MKILYIIALINPFLLFGFSFGQSRDALKYIKENAISVDTSTNKLKAISSLKSTFTGRRIICIGEATHGTHEFQTAKVNIFKFLVTEMHYKLFGIEANFTDCEKVNNYILYGQGNAKKVIAGMIFWMWNTKEVFDMVEWMRNYNKDKTEAQKIKFFGFDMQNPKSTIQQITFKLNKLDSVYFNSHYQPLLDFYATNAASTQQQRDTARNLLLQLKKYVNEQESNLLKLFPKDDPAYLPHYVRILEQNIDLAQTATKILNRGAYANRVRDKYMAENVQWILNNEGADSKIMLWAHNIHACKASSVNGAMGEYLKNVYGDSYYAIGFDFNKGSFRAVDLQEKAIKVFTVNDAVKGSCASILSGLDMPEFFIDIEMAVKTDTAARDFFNKKLLQRNIGWGLENNAKDSSYINGKLYQLYDGLIFVNETSPSIPLN